MYRHGLSKLETLYSSDKAHKATISKLQSTIASYQDTEDNGSPNKFSELQHRFNAMMTKRPDGIKEPIYMQERREKQELEVKLSVALERNAVLEKKRLELIKVRRIARHQHMRLKSYYDDGVDDEDDEGYKSWSSTEEFRRDPGGTNSYYAKHGVPIELQASPDSSPRGDTTLHSVGGLPGFAWNSQRAASGADGR